MEQFFTASLHDTPQKLTLADPYGEPTDHYIMVIGNHSQKVRETNNDLRYKVAMSEGITVEDAKAELIASMIESWSFDEEPTLENKLKLLKEAPQIADAVDFFGSNHGNFAKK